MIDPDKLIREISTTLDSLEVAGRVIKKHPNYPQYLYLLEDLREQAEIVKNCADSLSGWVENGGQRPQPMRG